MPISDDDYRQAALHALMALENDVYRALNGDSPSRDATRGLADEMRAILAHADKELHEDTDELHVILERARRTVLGVFGTSGWDAVAAPPSLPPLPSSPGRKA